MCWQGPSINGQFSSEQPSQPEPGPPPRRVFMVQSEVGWEAARPAEAAGGKSRSRASSRGRSGTSSRGREPQREAKEELLRPSTSRSPSARPRTPGASSCCSSRRRSISWELDPSKIDPIVPESKLAHPGAWALWQDPEGVGGSGSSARRPQRVSLGDVPWTGCESEFSESGFISRTTTAASVSSEVSRPHSEQRAAKSGARATASRPCEAGEDAPAAEAATAMPPVRRVALMDAAADLIRRPSTASALDAESSLAEAEAPLEALDGARRAGRCTLELGTVPAELRTTKPDLGKGKKLLGGVLVELGTVPWEQPPLAELTRSESSALSSTLSVGQPGTPQKRAKRGRRLRGQTAPPAEIGRGGVRSPFGARIRSASGKEEAQRAQPGQPHVWLQGALEMRALDLYVAEATRPNTPAEPSGPAKGGRFVQRISGMFSMRQQQPDNGWRRCHVVLGPDGLAFWPPGMGPQSGQPPEGAFRFAELADVSNSGNEVTLKFKTKQDDASECNGDSLVLRASSASLAQRWGIGIRSAIAAKLVANLPSDWDVNAIATSSKFVCKQSLSQEITSVIQRLVDHCFVCKSTRDRRRREMPLRLQVTEVVRVENSVAWIAYDEARARLLRARKKHGPTERLHMGKPVMTSAIDDDELSGVLGTLDEELQEQWLFHGTTSSAVQGISDSQFRLDLAGSRRGTMYGNGVYLAECSSKADEYAEADTGGTCRMLLCRALLGRILKNCDRRPKGRELEAECRSHYDSLLGDREAAVGTFREFVLFDSSQVYPAYIVHYRRVLQPEFLRQIVHGGESCGDDILYAARLAEEHSDSVVRYRILLLLGNSAGKVVPTLVSYLTDERAGCRRTAACVLKQLATSLAPPDVSSEAIGAVCMSAAVPALQKASLRDRDPEVREVAAMAVREIKKYPT